MKSRAHSFECSAALGLGSNVGDRLAHLNYAFDALRRHEDIRLVKRSRTYRTAAHVLNPGDLQDDYLNAACLIRTSLEPRKLLEACLAIEQQRGRNRSEALRWEPRTLDIDLLTFDERTIDDPDLVVPHPRIAERRFVLAPLFEIAPDLRIAAPIDRSVQYLLKHCPDDSEVVPFAASVPGLSDS